MLVLERLQLAHFKSHTSGAFVFGEGVNTIVGENGSGKTNLLDAIYFLALTKSAFTHQDIFAVQHEADWMRLDGTFRHPVLEEQQITVMLQRGQRKVVQCDKTPYERLTEHIGKFPVVLMAPNDTDLVRGSAEERRRFFDGVLSQQNPEYLADLLQYNRILEQRASLLRQFHERKFRDEDLLEVYSQPLVTLGMRLYATRRNFLEVFLPVFQQHYANLSESREAVEIAYQSEVAMPDFQREFWLNRHRDLAAQRTTLGIHRDDYPFEINGASLRKFGSQGQQKSFVIALKLAQYEILANEKGLRPIVLLDDIFDKLDDRRIAKLLGFMENGTFGQVFLTDARPARTRTLFAEAGIAVNEIIT